MPAFKVHMNGVTFLTLAISAMGLRWGIKASRRQSCYSLYARVVAAVVTPGPQFAQCRFSQCKEELLVGTRADFTRSQGQGRGALQQSHQSLGC